MSLPQMDKLSLKQACQLEELPTPVLSHLFSYVEVNDLVNLSKCSSLLYDVVQIESVWQARCSTDYGVVFRHRLCDVGFQRFYKLILYKYGYLIGLWQLERACYGGLLQVQITALGLIAYIYEGRHDHHFTEPLIKRELFSICIENESPVIKCHQGKDGAHIVDIDMSAPRCCDNFAFSCYVDHFGSPPLALATSLDQYAHLERNRWEILKKTQEIIPSSRICLSPPFKNGLVKPGFFKGTYSSHGIEIIHLKYDNESNLAIGHKITGDPNIPANKTSFRINLDLIFVGTDNLTEASSGFDKSDLCLSNLTLKKFEGSCDVSLYSEKIPKQFYAKFKGEIQLAGTGYTNPRFDPCVWIIFDEDTFGVLPLTLSHLLMYSRVTEYDLYATVSEE